MSIQTPTTPTKTTQLSTATGAAAPAAGHLNALVGGAAPVTVLLALLLMRTVLIFAGNGLVYAAARVFHLSARPWHTAVLSSDVHIVVIADLVTLVVLTRLLRRRGARLRDLVGRVSPKDLPVGLLVFVIVIVAFLIATFAGNLAVYHGAPPASGVAPHIPLWFAGWTLLIMPITIALAEELLYRGYLQPQFGARIGRWPALIVVSAGFALQHAGLSALSADAVAARLITTFLGGLALGLLRIWLKRIAPLIFAHWLLDALLLGAPMIMLAASQR